MWRKHGAGSSTLSWHYLGDAVGPRFAIMAPPGPHYVAATWASWLCGGVAVPLCLTHPPGYAGAPHAYEQHLFTEGLPRITSDFIASSYCM